MKQLAFAIAMPFLILVLSVVAIAISVLFWAYLFVHIFHEFREGWKHEH